MGELLDLAALKRGCAGCSLGELCLPAAVSAADLERLDRLVAQRRPLARGATLFRAGDPLRALYVLREGALKTYSYGEEGELRILGFHLPGELFGLDALAEDRHRCDAEALIPSRVCEIPVAELERVAREIAGVQQQLMRILGRGAVRDQEHLEMMGRRHAVARIASFLLSLSRRYGALGFAPDRILLPMSRSDIANYLGLVIETVSRAFARLQGEGVIRVERRRVEILDPKRLAALCHEDEGSEPAAAGRRLA
ncbi:MAG: helix-turn-helix domain-containing protein [Xanthomonadales bacterium]|nr:helix-turn-helix domain-containing protein [Xanthomonadales bacterium]